MGLDHDKLKRTRAGARGGMGWKPKPGDNKVRILPVHSRFLTDWEAVEDLSLPYKIHFFRIEGRPVEVSRCLEAFQKKCPACDTWRVHRKSTDVGLEQLARDIAPAEQFLFNILDLNNLQAGIQQWASNWTCRDKIMAIAANAAWGNIIDPADGVDFVVNLIPGSQARSGYNTYEVTPQPQRTNVMAVLEAIPDWEEALNELETKIPPAKTAEEIAGLLDEMSFPPLGGAAAAVAPRPATAPAQPIVPANTPAADASATAAPAATTSAPPPNTAAAPAPTPVAAAAPATPPPAAATEVHYDPGPEYVPKVADDDRPAGSPRCFADYKPEVHRCAPCPVLTPCQMRMLGVKEA
jgi:hypothetical protein